MIWVLLCLLAIAVLNTVVLVIGFQWLFNYVEDRTEAVISEMNYLYHHVEPGLIFPDDPRPYPKEGQQYDHRQYIR